MTTPAPSGGPQGFFAGIFIRVIQDPGVQAVAKAALKEIVAEQIVPLIPLAVGAAVKAAVDEVIVKVPGAEGVVDAINVTDAAIKELKDMTGIDLDNLLGFWKH